MQTTLSNIAIGLICLGSCSGDLDDVAPKAAAGTSVGTYMTETFYEMNGTVCEIGFRQPVKSESKFDEDLANAIIQAIDEHTDLGDLSSIDMAVAWYDYWGLGTEQIDCRELEDAIGFALKQPQFSHIRLDFHPDHNPEIPEIKGSVSTEPTE